MKISELLERKGSEVATIRPDATVHEAVAVLARRNIGALVVSGDGRTIEGIVSERDVVRALARSGLETMAAPVSSLMSLAVRTCAPDDTVDSLITTMTEHRIRHVPVASGGQLAGIVSIGDVVKTRMDELEKDRDALVSYIEAR